MCARGGVVTGGRVFHIRFACADGVEEMAKVRDGRILLAFVFEVFRLWFLVVFLRLDFGSDYLRVPVIRLFERLGPALDDPVVVLNRLLGIEGHAVINGQSSFGAEDLKSRLRRELIVK